MHPRHVNPRLRVRTPMNPPLSAKRREEIERLSLLDGGLEYKAYVANRDMLRHDALPKAQREEANIYG
jgi:hypothetical protein